MKSIARLTFILLYFGLSCTSSSVSEKDNDGNDSNQTEEIQASFSQVVFYDILENQKKLNKNKLTFINLWATWCTPCIKEMPSLKSMKDQIGDKMDYIFATYESPDKLKRFVEKSRIDLPFYTYDDTKVPVEMQTQLLPYTIIVRGDSILFEKTGGTEWDKGPTYQEILNLVNP